MSLLLPSLPVLARFTFAYFPTSAEYEREITAEDALYPNHRIAAAIAKYG